MSIDVFLFKVAHFDFGNVIVLAVLDNNIEATGIAGCTFQDNATRFRNVLTAQVRVFKLKTFQVRTLDPYFTKLAVYRNIRRRALRLDFFVRHDALFFGDCLVLAVRSADFFLDINKVFMLDAFLRDRKLFDDIGRHQVT